MKNLAQHLEIKGKNVWFLRKDEGYFIAIKPICEALGVDYIQQFKNLKVDSILGAELCKYTMQVPGDQPRNFICLPEKFIYGWLFSVKSESPVLLEYKKKVYDILFNHFHGSLTERKNVLIEKAEIKTKRQLIEVALKEDERYSELCELKGRELRIGKTLKDLDEKLIDSQLALCFQS